MFDIVLSIAYDLIEFLPCFLVIFLGLAFLGESIR